MNLSTNFIFMNLNPLVIKTPRGECSIGPGHPTFIIAEMSGNHNQNFDTAVKIVKAAAAAGADAIKLQTYTPDTITIDSDQEWFRVTSPDHPGAWQGKTLYQLYQAAYTPWEWHAPLQAIATDLGLVFFSTPFDSTAVDFLETLRVPCYKIASYEANHTPLHIKVAQTKKPVIMSVGFASRSEINLAVTTLRQHGAPATALLHCVTSYSSEPDLTTTNLRTMADLADQFKVVTGFSDNNGGIEAAVTAVAAGAAIIEKHLVLKSLPEAVDAKFSLTPEMFTEMVRRIRKVETMLGKVSYGPQNAIEEYNKRYRQSLFVVRDLKHGDIFTSANVRCIRPAFGLEPKHYQTVLGKRASADIKRGTPLRWDLVTL